jgi:hypothetical protein
MTATTKEKPEADADTPLLAMRDWKLWEHANNQFRLIVDVGVDAAKLPSEFWCPVATQLHPLDRIDVMTRDAGRFVELLVCQVNPRGVDVTPLRALEIPRFAERDAADLPMGYAIQQDPVTGMWKVIRPDGAQMGDVHPRKELAREYLVTHPVITQPVRPRR